MEKQLKKREGGRGPMSIQATILKFIRRTGPDDELMSEYLTYTKFLTVCLHEHKVYMILYAFNKWQV